MIVEEFMMNYNESDLQPQGIKPGSTDSQVNALQIELTGWAMHTSSRCIKIHIHEKKTVLPAIL